MTRNLTGEDYCQDCENSGFWWNGWDREPCGNCEKGQQVKVWWVPPWMKYQHPQPVGPPDKDRGGGEAASRGPTTSEPPTSGA